VLLPQADWFELMSCFVCPVFGEKRCDGSCGLGCVGCPGLSFDDRVEAVQGRINAGQARSENVSVVREVLARGSVS